MQSDGHWNRFKCDLGKLLRDGVERIWAFERKRVCVCVRVSVFITSLKNVYQRSQDSVIPLWLHTHTHTHTHIAS